MFFHVLKLFSTWIRGIRIQNDGRHPKFIADSKKVNHLVFEKGTLCGGTSHFLAEKSTHDPAFAGYDPNIYRDTNHAEDGFARMLLYSGKKHHLKTSEMSLENQWLEDVVPIEIVPF